MTCMLNETQCLSFILIAKPTQTGVQVGNVGYQAGSRYCAFKVFMPLDLVHILSQFKMDCFFLLVFRHFSEFKREYMNIFTYIQ